jgi:hypothetical protein
MMVEWLIAVPVMLTLGLGFFQASELLVARMALRHALFEAARAGSVSNANAQAIMQGLGDGLSPWLFGSQGAGEIVTARLKSRAQVNLGRSSGWIELRQRSPTTASFGDWGEPARDDSGPINQGRQIAFDALPTEYRLRQPASGASGDNRRQGGAPVGRESGQSLADANLLVLEMTYGVPVRVPFAGSILLTSLRMLNGCGSGLSISRPGSVCRYYNAIGLSGQPAPRIPVRVHVAIRMQSPARMQGSLLESR